AGCDESRTSGAEGGPGKRARSNPGTAPRSDPYIVGKNQRSAIGTLVERQTRLIRLMHLPTRDADSLRIAIATTMGGLPSNLIRSITWDQGIEMARHTDITADLGVPVYFCDSRSPWQRGSNENANGLLRQYFPKGTSLSTYTPDHLRAVEYEINNRPRHTLEDRSPAELFTALLTSPDHQLLRR
ncbi:MULTISPECIES: IS30 family transposase, partial [unclassified Mycobacteroides]